MGRNTYILSAIISLAVSTFFFFFNNGCPYHYLISGAWFLVFVMNCISIKIEHDIKKIIRRVK